MSVVLIFPAGGGWATGMIQAAVSRRRAARGSRLRRRIQQPSQVEFGVLDVLEAVAVHNMDVTIGRLGEGWAGKLWIAPFDDLGRQPSLALVQASLLGPSLTVPFVDRRTTLDMWQQVVLIDFVTRPRTREVVVQLVGE